MSFNKKENLPSFQNPNFIEVNLPIHICLWRNCQLFLTLRHWNYSKCKDILNTLNVYKIPAKAHQVDCSSHRWIINFENIVLKLLTMSPPNITKLQKTKENENCPIYNFFFFKCPIRLGDNSRIFFRKTKKYPLNIRFLYQFLISSSKYVSLLLHYYKKLKSVKNSKIQISLIGSNQ